MGNSQMNERDTYIYLAGLFDGEACVTFKVHPLKRKNRPGCPTHNVRLIRVEISMTNEILISWIHQVFGFGWCKARKFNTVPSHYKQQWRWACSYRNAYKLAKLLQPHSKILKAKWEKIIKHYDTKLLKQTPPQELPYAKTEALLSS